MWQPSFGFFHRIRAAAILPFLLCAAQTGVKAVEAKSDAGIGPAVKAFDFRTVQVYRSKQHPGYTSWVSFFPGEKGQWYLTCEEVTRPKIPLPQCTREQWYEMSLPVGYDKSQYRMEIVMLESKDDMKTWKVISRQPVRFHHSAGSFGQARTKDGRFLRFMWSMYSLDSSVKPNEILYVSVDNGKTWKKMPAFHDPHFASAPHRLRTLSDGTLVLAVPLLPKYKAGTDRPIRAATNLDAASESQMTLFFSHDQGRTWDGPLPIFAAETVTETDFVELPSGDLLFFNNSIFAHPGRQFVYRQGRRFTPGPFERVGTAVPETVCLTEDGVLVGCLRDGQYLWSDDMGRTWSELEGSQSALYQPWIQYLGNGRVACAGHLGADDPIGGRDQFAGIQFFNVRVLRKTKGTRILMDRDFDEAGNRWINAFTLSLTSDGIPLAGKDLEFWYVKRDQPGYDPFNSRLLEERMKIGGATIRARTGADGKAHVALPALDRITDTGASIQFVVRFNMDRADPNYKPAQTPQFEFYCVSHPDPPLAPLPGK